jgi:hypothetical protein
MSPERVNEDAADHIQPRAECDVFVGLYWQKYGWVAPGEDVSRPKDEYRLAAGKPKLIYLKTRAPEREPRLAALTERIRADDHVSYKSFKTVAELRGLLADDLALLLTERLAQLEPRDIALTIPGVRRPWSNTGTYRALAALVACDHKMVTA